MGGLGEEESYEGGPRGGLGEEESSEGGPRVSISKGWEGWARRRAMKVDLGYQSVRVGRVGRGGEL